MSGVFILQGEDKLLELDERPYDSEELLQKRLAQYPSLIAGDQINPNSPRRWLLIKREAPVADSEDSAGRWSLDHLFVDQDAVPTLVEVKRATDTRVRREVVAQMLDYAANGVAYWTLEELQGHFEASCREQGRQPEEALAEFLADSEQSPDHFWEQMMSNLKEGRLRLLFVADRIPRELQAIIEFLNKQMTTTEVLGVEIHQFVGDGEFKALVSRVVGQTVQAQQVKSAASGRRQWDEASFMQRLLELNDPKIAEVAQRILEWSRERVARIEWGTGSTYGSFVPAFEHDGKVQRLFAVYGCQGATFEVYFQFYRVPPFDTEHARKEVWDRLNSIPGVEMDHKRANKRPNLKLAIFTDPAKLKRLLDTFDWFISEIKSANK